MGDKSRRPAESSFLSNNSQTLNPALPAGSPCAWASDFRALSLLGDGLAVVCVLSSFSTPDRHPAMQGTDDKSSGSAARTLCRWQLGSCRCHGQEALRSGSPCQMETSSHPPHAGLQ